MTMPDRGPKAPSPFENSFNDPERQAATGILLGVVSGQYPEMDAKLIEEWALCAYQIDNLGYDHGTTILRELNSLVLLGDGLSLFETQTVISSYCKGHNLRIPRLKPTPGSE